MHLLKERINKLTEKLQSQRPRGLHQSLQIPPSSSLLPPSSALPLLVSFSNFPESTGNCSFPSKHLPVNFLRTKSLPHQHSTQEAETAEG